MKKIAAAFMSIMILLSQSGCVDTRSQAEKDLEEANKQLAQARENARKASEDYENTVKTLEEYNRLREALGN